MRGSTETWLSRVAAAAMAACLLAAYVMTMAPGLTWANGGSDGGDLIAAAATGGIPHPTGYPVYLLLARLFQWLPLGSLAYRTNLLSAASTVTASLFLYATLSRALRAAGAVASISGGVIAGVSFGLAPLVWSQAVITEVYGLGVLFVGVLLYLLTNPSPPSPRAALLTGLVQGLALGNQVVAAAMIPATLLCVGLRGAPALAEIMTLRASLRRLSFDRRALGAACLGMGLGLLAYLILPLRAASHPPVNWGDPVTASRFFWLVSANLYQNQLVHLNLPSSWANLRAWAALGLQSYGILGLIAGTVGLVVFFRPTRLHFVTLWIAAAFTTFAIQYEVVDSYVYLLPTFLAFSAWIGLGIGEGGCVVTRYLPRGDLVLAAAGLGYLAVLGNWHGPQVNAAHDGRAEQFGQYVMSEAPPRAILFTQSDRVVLSLRYFHYALRQRPDIALIANELLPFDWYRDNLRHTYPDLVIPAPSTTPWLLAVRGANPLRPVCYLYSDEPPLNCP